MRTARKTPVLDSHSRNLAWDSLDHVDLVVIGAGVTGAGIALDAASRGMSVVIVDKHDIAFGTSRWSSKLAHGGLRYLASLNFGIATRSARERGIMMEVTAPHLVHSLPQVMPVMTDSAMVHRFLPRIGFIAGDVLRIAAGTSRGTLPMSRSVTAARVRDLAPAVRSRGLLCGFVNYDGQLVDDARLVTAIVRTAASFGAEVLTHTSAHQVTGNSVVLHDELGHHPDRILTAGAVVNATGVWAGDIDSSTKVRPSRGTHLIFPAEVFGNPTGALTVPVPGHVNRFCFVLPAPLGRVYLGLTDMDSPGPIPDVPEVPEEDVDFLLDVINPALQTAVTRDDMIGSFAGLRPLIDSGDGDTADVSREHAIFTNDDGVITVVGGKLTEYRLMAQQTVDLISSETCRTKDIPLVGAGPVGKPPEGTPDWVRERYGSEAAAVVNSCALERPLERVADGIDVTRAEFAWAVTHEGALTVSDILDRRTRVGLVDSDREAALPAAEEALALVKGAS